MFGWLGLEELCGDVHAVYLGVGGEGCGLSP